MTQDMRALEQDIEQTRARLDLSIDRLQDKITDKMSVSGIVDDLIGRGRQTRYASMFDHTLAVIKRNPVPVMLIAAGVGWLIHRMSREGERHDRRYVAVVPPSRGLAPDPNAKRTYDPGSAPVAAATMGRTAGTTPVGEAEPPLPSRQGERR